MSQRHLVLRTDRGRRVSSLCLPQSLDLWIDLSGTEYGYTQQQRLFCSIIAGTCIFFIPKPIFKHCILLSRHLPATPCRLLACRAKGWTEDLLIRTTGAIRYC
jgi:hypothetical protein